jgi:hypothetical protein
LAFFAEMGQSISITLVLLLIADSDHAVWDEERDLGEVIVDLFQRDATRLIQRLQTAKAREKRRSTVWNATDVACAIITHRSGQGF